MRHRRALASPPVASPPVALLPVLAGLVAACGAFGAHEVDYWIAGELHGTGLVERGDQEGLWTYCYPSGQIAKQGRYENDEQVGKWTLWYPDGEKEQEGYFLEGGYRGGLWTYWHPDGSEYAKGCFDEGFEEGGWVFRGEGGMLQCEGEFHHGRQSGEWRFYHPGGGLRAVGLYTEGQKIGTWRYFDPDGTDAGTEEHPVPGDLALVQEARPDGSLERAGFVQGGRAAGRWTTWHPNGARKLGGEFVGGRPAGLWTARSADGNWVAAGEVEDGMPIGEWNVFESGVMRVVPAGELGAARPAADPDARPVAPDPTGTADASRDAGADLRAWFAEVAAPWADAAVVPLVAKEAGRQPARELAASTRRKPEAPIAPAPITRSEVEDAPGLVDFYAWGDAIRVGAQVEAGPYGESKRLGESLAGWRGRRPSMTRFVSPDMSLVDLDRLKGEPVLLVILRGMPGRGREVCIYCNTQVKAYAARAPELGERCRLVVVYPGPVAQLAAFQTAYAQLSQEETEIPFQLVADVDEELVRELGIEADLAHPTTLLFDRQGQITWTYRGLEDEDRPTVATLLRELRRLDS